jgi:hypothetical protein
MTVEDKWLPEAVDFKPPTGVVPVLADEALAKPPAGRPTTRPASQPAGGPASIPASAPAGKSTKRGEK